MKNFKEIFTALLKERVPENLAQELKIDEKKSLKRITVYDAMALIQLKKALGGDIKSFELIQKTVEDKEPDPKDGGVIRVMITDE